MRKYSSFWYDKWHKRSMLDSPQAWSSRQNAIGEYMVIDLGMTTWVAAVVTQKRKGSPQNVYQYEVYSSDDGITYTYRRWCWGPYISSTDYDHKKECTMSPVFQARYVKFRVVAWTQHSASARPSVRPLFVQS